MSFIRAKSPPTDDISDPRSWLPPVLLLAICGLSAMWVHHLSHPYYFGDELSPFRYCGLPDAFRLVFDAMNGVRPRLLYHALWAWVAESGVSRSSLSWLVSALWCMVIAGAYLIARRLLECPWQTSLLVAAIAAGSRFAVMLGYDYAAGVVELGALAAFLGALALALPAADRPAVGSRAIAAAIACAVAAAMIHERYVAASIALALVTGACALRARAGRLSPSIAGLALGLLVLPLGVFSIGTRLLGNRPLLTETVGSAPSLFVGAGVNVKLEAGLIAQVLEVSGKFLSNVFLASNFGRPWVVGTGLPEHLLIVLVALSAVSVAAGVYAWVRWPLAGRRAVMIVAPLLALVAVAAIPGEARAEARWMFPVSVLAAMLVAQLRPQAVAQGILMVMLTAHAAYHVRGGWEALFNVSASRAADAVGTAVARAKSPAGWGLVIGFVEPEISWVLGQACLGPDRKPAEGSRFSVANRLSPTVIPDSRFRASDAQRVGFGVAKRVGGDDLVVISPSQTLATLEPGSVSAAHAREVGGAGLWEGWSWSTPPMVRPEGVVLSAGQSGWSPLDVELLADRIVVYEASAAGSAPARMRLQVNWVRADQSLVAASIRVVEVVDRARAHAMVLLPPPGARFGLVYATLHDEARADVVLHSVRVLDVR